MSSYVCYALTPAIPDVSCLRHEWQVVGRLRPIIFELELTCSSTALDQM